MKEKSISRSNNGPMRTKHEALTSTLQGVAARLSPGDRFPSQTELMRQYNVSDRTVLRSLEDLQRSGWIVRRRGSGTYVADPARRDVPEPAAPARVTHDTIAGISLSLSARSFYRTCIDELSQLAESEGKSLVCQLSREESGDANARLLEALNPRGFVFFSYHFAPHARRLLDRGFRVVVVGAPPSGIDPKVPSVFADHDYGGHLAANHLIELGHRRIAYCFTNPSHHRLEETLRWQGHARAIEEARGRGLEIANSILRQDEVSRWSEDPDRAAEYFSRPDSATAIAAWNDNVAIQLISLLHRAGIRIPEDVSIIGFDDVKEGQTSAPALTTVNQYAARQMRIVLDLLTRPEPPPDTQSYVIVPTLTVRASCGEPSR